ncbi:MAG: PhzF family phenazine biosynthesis protein [Novosphingobium sp.]|jgi:PhzF family phenazine biosynthesis protein|uniref:PhzF family phenazine biosynthesis protein n=1 Tax=Novosphingobium sp. TaxID=1874826 RepID=UPI00301A9259
MSQYPFQLVDVFGEAPFSGNPLAVIALQADRETAELQAITRWLNLSETAFLLPPTTPDADYRVRIFTLDRELPFAGHPTLGSCHAWLAWGGVPKNADVVVQECGAGLISVRRGSDGLAFAAPPLLRSGPVDTAKLAEACQVLGIGESEVIAAQWIDNGPGWLGIQLRDAACVLAVEPARSHSGRIDIGLVGLHGAESPYAYEVRAIFSDPCGGLIEDPVTGSLNASAAQWMIAEGLVTPPYTATQGARLGRAGRIHITQDPGGPLWVGGNTSTLFAGETGQGAL